MPAGGFRTFVAGEVLDEDDINDYLMQGVLVFGGTATRDSAIGTPVEGQFAFLTDSDTLTYYDGSSWADYEAGFYPATVDTTTGSPNTGSFTDANGFAWDWYEFTGNGSITFSGDGYADILVVGGGGASKNDSGYAGGGGAGAVRYGLQFVDATSYSITIGAGGSGTINIIAANAGSDSSFGSLVRAPGGQGGLGSDAVGNLLLVSGTGTGPGIVLYDVSPTTRAGGGSSGASNNYDGTTLNYKNSSITYGVGGHSSTPVANTGSGGDFDLTNDSGTDGVVIVRVLS